LPGCFTCRARRVLCDKDRPVCSHCNRLSLECAFPDPTEVTTNKRGATKHARSLKTGVRKVGESVDNDDSLRSESLSDDYGNKEPGAVVLSPDHDRAVEQAVPIPSLSTDTSMSSYDLSAYSFSSERSYIRISPTDYGHLPPPFSDLSSDRSLEVVNYIGGHLPQAAVQQSAPSLELYQTPKTTSFPPEVTKTGSEYANLSHVSPQELLLWTTSRQIEPLSLKSPSITRGPGVPRVNISASDQRLIDHFLTNMSALAVLRDQVVSASVAMLLQAPTS
jgi:Fungal Zn(2)-Cys(6) binuclear cluster domain